MTTREFETFPTFDPHKDITVGQFVVGQFVAVCSSAEDKTLGAVST